MKAVILAAGKGTRMGHITDDVPKPMIRVKGKPLLEHILDRLGEAGVTESAIVTGYRGQTIEEYFARYPMRISFLHQVELTGTATAVRLAREFVGDDAFLLTFGDIWCEAGDYRGLMTGLGEDAAGVIGVRRVEDPWQGAAVYERDGRVVRMVEKPPMGTSATNWNSAGLYVFRAEIFGELGRVEKSARGEYEITSAIEAMISGGRFFKMYAIEGVWRDVGRPEDLAALNESR